MRGLPFLGGLASVASFPSYIPCATDSETLLKVGTHTCSRARGKKGSNIASASFGEASLSAKTLAGKHADSIAPGQTLTLTLDAHLLDPLLGESLWMVARVSDAGANGTLLADTDLFEAQCPSQIVSMHPVKTRKTEFTYRAPCTAAADIIVTVIHSRCLFGCSTGAVASGLITPEKIVLNDLTLSVQGELDVSCGSPAPAPLPGHRDICRPTVCWDGSCEQSVDETVAPQQVPMKKMAITVDRWNTDAKSYENVGHVDAWTMQDPRWQSLLHGPTRLGGNRTAGAIPGKMPPVYVSVDSSNSIFRVDDLAFDGSPATSTRVAWVAGAASQHHIMDDSGENLLGMIVSSGQPFGDTVGANSSDHMITQGGLYAVGPEGCHKLWPSEVDQPEFTASGEVVNRVICHSESGICFFSNWNHEFDADSKIPHCLHWCALDDLQHPTRCAAGEPLAGGPGSAFLPGRFCAEPSTAKDGSEAWVGPHGMLLGEAHQSEDGSWNFEMIVSWTDGLMGMDKGVSFARKLHIVASRQGTQGIGTKVRATKYEAFGTELTTDTLADTGSDLRLDHMWRDASGHVWFSTFGDHNMGEHVLDYATGRLLLSFRGFQDYPHIIKQYNPSGISIVGGLGQPGAVAIVALETVPPLPFIHGALAFVDISQDFGISSSLPRAELV